MMKRSLFLFALMMSAAAMPARADDVSNRIDQLEQQIRQLVGQVEELNFTVKQLQTQMAAAPKQMGAADPVVPVVPVAPAPAVLPLKKKLVLQQPTKLPNEISGTGTGVETIESAPLQNGAAVAQDETLNDNSADAQVAGAAPQPKILGAMGNKAAKVGDGGFQGQVIVPLGEGDLAATADDSGGAAVEPVSLQPETPDDLFLRAEQALLQLRYSDAESGFRELLTKFPDHSLAGVAQYKLGETFYAQQQYSEAAQNYMLGYKQFPKSRRAADSLLKFGLSLNRMGQQEQGCAAIGSVGDEFPNAVEVKKRAQTEFRRASC